MGCVLSVFPFESCGQRALRVYVVLNSWEFAVFLPDIHRIGRWFVEESGWWEKRNLNKNKNRNKKSLMTIACRLCSESRVPSCIRHAFSLGAWAGTATLCGPWTIRPQVCLTQQAASQWLCVPSAQQSTFHIVGPNTCLLLQPWSQN